MEIKNVIIGIAIAILTMFVVIYGINTFYVKPEYYDFCKEIKTIEFIDTEKSCLAAEGKWMSVNSPRIKPIMEEDSGIVKDGYCNRDYYCRQEYDDAQEKYSGNVFLIAVPLGIILIFIGAYLFTLEFVGAGLMGGGVGTLLYGAGGYWRYADNWLRFLISLVGLVVLIWFAYRFNEKFTDKKKIKKKVKKRLR